jgi:MATE family multidrug resistance protein
MGIGGVLAFAFGDRAMSLFSADPEVIAAGVAALKALSLALPFWALWFVSSGALRGSGDTRSPLIIGASAMWVSVLLAWIFVRWFDGGLGLVWLAFVLTTTPASVLMAWAFTRRIRDFEQGRRELSDVAAAVSH